MREGNWEMSGGQDICLIGREGGRRRTNNDSKVRQMATKVRIKRVTIEV